MTAGSIPVKTKPAQRGGDRALLGGAAAQIRMRSGVPGQIGLAKNRGRDEKRNCHRKADEKELLSHIAKLKPHA
jgi:hypothetical protein